jgi:prepilin-type N-terminal cleavage/methylation domain-containing protein
MMSNSIQTQSLQTQSLQTRAVQTRAHRSRSQHGFTLLEMLLGMGILGIVLMVSSALLQSNQAAAATQQARTTSLEDARASMSRIAETLNRAAYIYPSGITISVTSGLVGKTTTNAITTGAGAMAMLVSDRLNATPRGYYGVIFYLTDRSKTKFSPDLQSIPSNRIGESVLVEARTTQTGAGPITWAANTNPATASTSWVAAIDEGVMADGVLAASTNLMASATFSPSGGLDDSVFGTGTRSKNPAMTANTALLVGVGYNLSLQIAPTGKTLATTGPTVLRGLASARGVPRR